ncbi:hypothetical protein AWM70_17255 [Paenibacillus yonginensis]|uniref:SbsA Ig-like domain-containing protein n=1 Tax=Paenibacillus yonginensis TaxID=1462996 RepID=A0A1B1N3W6_9BACL|nr:hypothetical protein [Paenibacillus yonginensis]ANS76114.1 hypothetical protein AWM70_17255 [Paenibacillus yonginensis]
MKQITVAFDGEVDAETAENVANYKINRTIKSADLSSDNKTVVLTLDGEYYTDANKLENQKEVKLTVSGVKNSDKSKTITQDITFTPVDVTTPSVKEVTGLGTKAFKVVFSEPVDRATAISTANYKIDGKAIAGSVEYAYPDAVVISTALTTGDHKLTVSNVQDFSGLKVVPVESDLTVSEDTEAPTVASVKTTDLSKVVVTFNEPVKSVGTVYNGISSKTGTVTHSTASNEVTVTFTKDNALSVNENTLVFNNVTDYSGNSATREVKVTPTLDTTRPEVVSVTSDADQGNTILKVKYSKAVNDTALKGANYTVKDANGKVVTGNGLDANGHPVRTITWNATTNTATITFAGALNQGTYTLDITGVQDTAYVANTILPVSTSFTVGDSSEFKVSKFWHEVQTTTGNKHDVYFYVSFSKPVATSGVGDATSIAKYSISWDGTDNFTALPVDSYVDLVTPETVRITVPYTEKTLSNPKLKVSLIADQDGNLAYDGVGYVSGPITENSINVGVDKVEATAKDTIKVTFDDKLTSVDPSDFRVTTTDATYNVNLDSYSYDGSNTIATFTVVGDLGAAPVAKFILNNTTSPSTQNAFGGKVKFNPQTITDKVAPETVDVATNVPFKVTSSAANTYKVHVYFNEGISVVEGTNLVDVTATGVDVSDVSYDQGAASNELVITFTTNASLDYDSVITVSLAAANTSAKAITDASTNKNAAAGFTKAALYSAVK